MKRTAVAVPLALTLALLSGCGGTGTGASSASSTPTPSDSTSASTSPSPTASPTGVPPNTGANALRLGQTRHGLDVDTTVLAVQQPAEAPSYATPDTPTDHWILVNAKMCVHVDYKGKAFPTDWTDFEGLDGTGGRYMAASSSWDGWPPPPQYPRNSAISGGECVKGSFLLTAGPQQRIKMVGLTNGEGGYAAQWKL